MIRSLGLRGRVVFFVHLAGARPGPNPELFVADLDRLTLRQLTDTRNGNFDARWSPDGTRIAFRSDRDLERPTPAFRDEIYVMRADGSRQRNVTRNKTANDGWPAWSPHGSRIVFASERRSRGHTDLWVMDAGGRNLSLLYSSPEPDEAPDWSRGNRIVFKSWRTRDWELYAVNADGSHRKRLTYSGGEDTGPRWSPDGKRIAFLSKRDVTNPDQDSIYVMNADGSGQRALTRPGYYSSPAWSPDGRYLLIPASAQAGQQRDRSGGLYVLDTRARGRALRKILSGDAGSAPDWHP